MAMTPSDFKGVKYALILEYVLKELKFENGQAQTLFRADCRERFGATDIQYSKALLYGEKKGVIERRRAVRNNRFVYHLYLPGTAPPEPNPRQPRSSMRIMLHPGFVLMLDIPAARRLYERLGQRFNKKEK